MEASSARKRLGGRSLKDLTSTREGAFTLAAAAAVLAALLLLLFAHQYRNQVNDDAEASSVLVARSLIPKGSSGDVIASDQLLSPTKLKGSQVKSGAIVDPAILRGQVAVKDIYPGQQITAGDFTHSGETVVGRLRGNDRAISVPVDSAHGLVGQVQSGDHVDVLAGLAQGGSGRATLSTLVTNVLVLRAASGGGGGAVNRDESSNIILRVSDANAVKIAFAADNGKVWIVLRPPTGATATKAGSVSQQSLTGGGG